MTFYERMQALADRQIAAKGASLTIRALPTASDPVSGLGYADGATRSVEGVLTRVDYRVFPETVARSGDLMLLTSAAVAVGEKWINGSAEWSIVAVQEIKPDNATGIAWKALVRG